MNDSVVIEEKLSFKDLQKIVGDEPEVKFTVRGRGRPETDPEEARIRKDRRNKFGRILKDFRESRNMTLASAAEAAGIASARKLSQYETTCYPPGWVVRALAPVYGVDEKYLAALVISHADPDMFAAVTDHKSLEEFIEV